MEAIPYLSLSLSFSVEPDPDYNQTAGNACGSTLSASRFVVTYVKTIVYIR